MIVYNLIWVNDEVCQRPFFRLHPNFGHCGRFLEPIFPPKIRMFSYMYLKPE